MFVEQFDTKIEAIRYFNRYCSKASNFSIEKWDMTSGEYLETINIKNKEAIIMTSEQIAKKLGELETEKATLEKELMATIERENKEREQNQIDKIKAAIRELWSLYWKDDDNTESEKNLSNILDIPRLQVWLESDVAAALKKSKLNDIDRIREIVTGSETEIDFEKCVREAEIRLDFASALRSVKDGTDLSYPLGWGFGRDDLMALMALHKSNKFRRKIEDLLEDCNFHTECGLLSKKQYKEFERFVNEN